MVVDCRTFLQRGTVVRAYRMILGREPESDSYVAGWMELGCKEKLIATFLESEEFSRRTPREQALAHAAIDAGMIE